ncbi:MAG: methyltransferase [Candidatus Aenigmarchaeota archaeon]|nr:methyltransferase [Candidatus Aenigmarchaeota archaeon]
MGYAFDVIGSKDKAVAIIDSKIENEKQVAQDIMKQHKNVKSVLKKKSGRTGVYRIYSLKLVAGSRDTEVIHKEHGCFLKLDPKKVYFSPRESTERKRIAEKVKPKDSVLVMFSGIGPYAITIAKKHPKANIVAIEINLDAVIYAEKNIKLNKIKNIKNYCWDVREARYLGKFDRIIMPLPETAIEFLDSAFLSSKKGTVIHLYGISNEPKKFSDLRKKVKEMAKTFNIKYKIISDQKVLPYAPKMWKVRLDIKIL